MTSIKECKGCTLLRNTEYHDRVKCRIVALAVTKDEEVKDCPCTTCLVKVTCNAFCNSWIIYRQKGIDNSNLQTRNLTNIAVKRGSILIDGDTTKYDRHY